MTGGGGACGCPRKQGFALDWMLSGSRDESMLGYPTNSYPEGQEAKPVIGKEAAVYYISQDTGCWIIFVVLTMFLLLSEQR